MDGGAPVAAIPVPMRRHTVVLLIATSFAGCATADAGRWPAFRGPGQSGVSDGHPTPAAWNVTSLDNVAWRVRIPGHGHSSPIVWGTRIFVSTAIGSTTDLATPSSLAPEMVSSADQSRQVWKIYAFDTRSGGLIWDRTARSGVPHYRRHPLNSFATPTPATDGRHLVVSFGDVLFCYTLDGDLLWQQDLGEPHLSFYVDPTLEWGPASSPVIHDGLVIIQHDSDRSPFVAAFRVTDGRRIWTVARTDFCSWSSPTIFGQGRKATVVVAAPNYLRAYEVRSGRERWSLYWGADITKSTPLATARLLYATHGQAPASTILAIRPAAKGDITLDGGATTNAYVAWSYERAGAITPTPLLYRGQVYVLSDMGILRALDADTGRLLYQQRVGGGFLSSPVATDSKLYACDLDGDVHVFAAGPVFREVAVNAMGESCQATPAIANGTIFFRTTRSLFALRLPSGTQSVQ